MAKVLIDRELLERAASMELDTTTRSIRTQDELRAILANPAQQGEVVREWIPVSERLPADSRDVLVYCSDTDEHMVGSSMGCGRFAFAFSERGTRICCRPSHWRYIDECDKPAAIAASTGQEGGKA